VKLGNAKVMIGDQCVGTVTSKPGETYADFELTFTMDAAALKEVAATFRKHRSGETKTVLVWSTADEPSKWTKVAGLKPTTVIVDELHEFEQANPALYGKGFRAHHFRAQIVHRAQREHADLEAQLIRETPQSDFAKLQQAHEQRIDELARDLEL